MLEKRRAKQIEARIEEMEKRCKELEENLLKMFAMVTRVSDQFEISQKKQDETAENQIEIFRHQFKLMREEKMTIIEAKNDINMELTKEENEKRAAIGQNEKVVKKVATFVSPASAQRMGNGAQEAVE